MLIFNSCLKKYCVCFAANRICTSSCRCDGCRNYGPDLLEPSNNEITSQNHIFSPNYQCIPQAPIPAYSNSFAYFDLDQTVQMLAMQQRHIQAPTIDTAYEEKESNDIIAV
mmetsp:Transcript_4856/g.9615  ORF Transcript_4856/g.9615 Transcript_4856/m.9615 type:complete len:111 (+) Transcript_4856:97-429(+)